MRSDAEKEALENDKPELQAEVPEDDREEEYKYDPDAQEECNEDDKIPKMHEHPDDGSRDYLIELWPFSRCVRCWPCWKGLDVPLGFYEMCGGVCIPCLSLLPAVEASMNRSSTRSLVVTAFRKF